MTLAHISAGINQKLAEPGGVSGKVTDAVSGVALGAVDVYLYDKSWNTVAVASTGSDGSYDMTHVRAGTYFVRFSGWRATGGSANGYPDQYYDGVPIEGTATSVTVAAGVTRTGIDAKLTPYD